MREILPRFRRRCGDSGGAAAGERSAPHAGIVGNFFVHMCMGPPLPKDKRGKGGKVKNSLMHNDITRYYKEISIASITL